MVIYIYIYIYKEERNKKKEHVVTRDTENACKRKGYTSNSGSSSKMGWVAEVFSLRLDCQEVIKKRKEKKRRNEDRGDKEVCMWGWP